MGKDSTIVQTTIGLAALLLLLEQKGVITEDEYKEVYETAKDTFVKEMVEELKGQF